LGLRRPIEIAAGCVVRVQHFDDSLNLLHLLRQAGVLLPVLEYLLAQLGIQPFQGVDRPAGVGALVSPLFPALMEYRFLVPTT